MIAVCGLRITDSPTRVPHPSRACARGDRNDVLARGGGRTESPIRNPQPAIRNPQSPHFPTWVAAVWSAYMLLTPLENQFGRTATTYYDVFVASPDRREAKLVGAIHRHCQPGERIYITGYRPRLWYLACRPPAVRHCGAMSAARLGEAGLPILKEIVAGLKRNPPKAIVTAGDELNRLFAAVDRGEQRSSLLYLTQYYELAPEISGGRLWIRRD